MGRQIVKQPNGLYAIWSNIVDSFVMLDATPEELITDAIEEASEKIRKDITETIAALDRGEKPSFQFTKTFDECVDWIRRHSEDGPNDGILQMLGIVTEGEWKRIECSNCEVDTWMKKIAENTYFCENCETNNVAVPSDAGAKPDAGGSEG